MSNRTESRSDMPDTSQRQPGSDPARAAPLASVHARVERWLQAAETRHLADLEFREVSRALRALSSAYVERRDKLSTGAALSGTGKRAAFALFYAPIHLLIVEHIVRSLGSPFTAVTRVLDLGCGSGASAAGWALACDRAIDVTGVDRHPWAIDEAKQTFRELGLRGTFRVDDFIRAITSRPRGGAGRSDAVLAKGAPNRPAILAAFALNELTEEGTRSEVRARLLDHASDGGHCLVIEPLAGRVAPWWSEWRRTFEAAGGRADEWRLQVPLPGIVQKLDRAAGLDHHELTARSLAL